MHGSHCTVVNGKFDDVRKHPYWAAHHGAKINFEYNNCIKTNGNYYWLTVRCPRLEEIRSELGLAPKPKWEWHITAFFIENTPP